MLLRATVEKPKIQLSPLVENMAVSKTIEIHALTKEMERNGMIEAYGGISSCQYIGLLSFTGLPLSIFDLQG
jgi:hypothetical protein